MNRADFSRDFDGGGPGDPADGCTVDAEEPGDIGGGTPGAEHGENFGLLLRSELGPPAAATALSACRTESGLGTFTHHFTFELGERPQHVHHHAPGRRCTVDVFGERTKAGASLLHLVEDEQKVFQRSREAVEFPDDEESTAFWCRK